MFRSVLAVIFGYFAMGVVAAAGQATLHVFGLVPENAHALTLVYGGFSLFFSAFGAIFGGFLCGTIAQQRPFRHAAILAAFVLFFGAAYAGQLWNQPPPNDPPHWYLLALVGVSAPGILFGGWLQKRRLRWRTSGD